MQHLSDGLLQELQQQGAVKVEQQGRHSGETPARGRGVAPRPSPPPASKASLSLSPPDRPHASSPAPPFVGETLRPPGESSPEISRRRSRTEAEGASPPEFPSHRSGSGPRAPSPPLRAPATSALPPQLLGGRVGANADVLKEAQTAVSTLEINAAHDATTAGAPRSLLSPHWTSHRAADFLPLQPTLQKDSPPETPASGTSGSSGYSAGSGSSKQSAASSMAFVMRDNRADRRLLTKKSMPSQHLAKSRPQESKEAESKTVLPRHEPKVVEDTAVTPLTPASPSKPPSPIPVPRPSSRSPVRHVRKSQSAGFAQSSNVKSPSQALPLPQISLKRPGIVRSSTVQDLSHIVSPPRQIRFRTPERTRSRSPSQELVSPTRMRISLLQPILRPGLSSAKHYHDVTPPEAEPGTPGRSQFVHGDSYFRPFGGETVYMKEFTPTMVPAEPEQRVPMPSSPPKVLPHVPANPPQLQRSPSDREIFKQSKRKRSSIFKLFRKSALTDSTYEAPTSGIVGTAPPNLPSWPDITISYPFESLPNPTQPADTHPQSYFSLSRSRRGHGSSEATPTSAKSPRSSGESESGLGARGLRSSSSTGEISPRTRPRSRPRVGHRHTLASMEEDDDEMPTVGPNTNLIPVVPAGAVSGPQRKYTSPDGKEYYKTSLLGSGGLQAPPLGTEQVHLPPNEHPAEGKKKHIPFKGFFVDVRNKPSEIVPADPESPEPPNVKRRRGLMPSTSMTTLLHKASLPQTNKLKRKASQATIVGSAPPSSLEVTGFQQTSFSQRYGNTKRAESSRIRALLDEALNDDGDDDDNDTQIGFELNVPDHLPSSPLCPLNPKHRSGGTAICPLHGRKRKKGPVVASSTPGSPPQTSGATGPRIVYEGGGSGSPEGQR